MKTFKYCIFFVFWFLIANLLVSNAYSQDEEVKLQKLTESLYVIISNSEELPYLGTVAFLITEEGVLVVDAGCSPEIGNVIIAKIQEITEKPIKYLVLTHGHWDHILGAQSFPPEVIVISHENTKKDITIINEPWINKSKNQILPQQIQQLEQELEKLEKEKSLKSEETRNKLKQARKDLEEIKQIKLVSPDITFNNEMEICIGGQIIKLLYLGPAHTKGNIIVNFTNENIIHIGDIHAFDNNSPYIENKQGAEGSAVNWLKIYDKITKMEVETIILGHDEITDMENFKKRITPQTGYLKDLINEVQMSINQGASLEDTKEKIKLPEYQHLVFYENNLPINIEVIYKELTAINNQLIQ